MAKSCNSQICDFVMANILHYFTVYIPNLCYNTCVIYLYDIIEGHNNTTFSDITIYPSSQ